MNDSAIRTAGTEAEREFETERAQVRPGLELAALALLDLMADYMDLGYDGELAAHVVGLRAPTEKEYVDYLRQRGVAEGHLVSPATYAQTYMRSRLQAVGRDVGPVRDDGLWDPRPMFEQIDSRDVRDIADSIAHAVRDELFKADAREPDVRRAEREPDMRPSERRPRGGW